MRVGLIVPIGIEQDTGALARYTDIAALALHAEQVGIDSLWVPDHLELDGQATWEAWTLLTALATQTTTIRLGTFVACTAFRPAGVLARMADTLQEISGNRLTLGLGAGWHQAEFDAYGLPFDHLASRFADAVEIVSTLLGKGRATVHGRYQSVVDASVPERPGRKTPPLMVAASGPRMQRMAATYADIWNFIWAGEPNARFRDANASLTRACEDIGRDPATLERTVGMAIGDHFIEEALPNDVGRLAEAFAAWRAEGVTEVICWPSPRDLDAVDLLAEAARASATAIDA